MKAGIALGSNIEPRWKNLREASLRLRELAVEGNPVLVSRVYETSPVDCPAGSPPFLNAVMEVTTPLSPAGLLERLQAIETAMGRPTEHGKNAPRPIDLDILYCDEMTLSYGDLTVPHPRLATRRFVLQPLADIRPQLMLPNFTQNVEELLACYDGLEKLEIFPDSLD